MSDTKDYAREVHERELASVEKRLDVTEALLDKLLAQREALEDTKSDLWRKRQALSRALGQWPPR